MPPRKPISASTETLILTKSARICAICFGLTKQLTAKRGQIAHVDHDRSNNKEDNLVFLCLEHHDEFDGRTSQSKGFTQAEVRFYRRGLYHAVENWDPQSKPRAQTPDQILPPQYGSVRELRIDILQRAMRQAGIWVQRLTSPGGEAKPSQALLKGFEEAFAEFQRARIDALLYVNSETATVLEEMAHSLSRAHLHRTQGDFDNWIRSDTYFERYALYLPQAEDQLRKSIIPVPPQ